MNGRWLLWLLLACLCLTSCAARYDLAASDGSTGCYTDVIDVDGGDAIVIRVGGKVIMIDTGYEETGDRVTAYLRDLGISAVDCLLITHFDKDHIGGVPTLLRSVTVRRVVHPVYEKGETKAYRNYLDALTRFGVPVTEVSEPTSLTAGGCLFEIFPAQGENYRAEDNDYSLVTRMCYGEIAFLFTGDAEEDRVGEMLRDEPDWSASVMKYPHHGSYNKQSETFVKVVDPDYVLITDGGEKEASEKLLSFLEARGCTVLRTSQGSVRLYTDGTSVCVLP